MMNESINDIRPSVQWESKVSSPSHETLGEPLTQDHFRSCYGKVFEEGQNYFALLDKKGDTEIYIVFSDIEEFERSTEGKVYLDFRTYRDRLVGVLWTLHDPKNPLGFPITFYIKEEVDRYKAIRLLEQDRIWIHYLAVNGEQQLLHIFSEAVKFPLTEGPAVEEMILECFSYREENKDQDNQGNKDDQDPQGNESVKTKSANELKDKEMKNQGTVYYINFKMLVERLGEEQAKIEAMELISRAFLKVQRHPRSEVRDLEIIFWAKDMKEEHKGEEAAMLELYVTSEWTDWFSKTGADEEEDPFTYFIYSLSEFVCMDIAAPLKEGAWPLMKYEDGTLYSLELDPAFIRRMQDLFRKTYPNAKNQYRQDLV